jgi:hypothetical protein
MARESNYASHDPRIKALISRSGRADLFKHLKIPRTTALYWISQGYDIDDPILDSLAQTIADMSDKLAETEKLLNESRATLRLLKQVYKIMGFRLGFKHIESAEIRAQILKSIAFAMKTQIRGIAAATRFVKILKIRFFNPSIVRDGEEGTVAPFFRITFS